MVSPVFLRDRHLYEVQPGLSTPHHRVRRRVSFQSQDQQLIASTFTHILANHQWIDQVCVCVCSCVFVWRLDSQMTSTMRKRRGLKLPAVPEGCGVQHQIRWVRRWRFGQTEVFVLTRSWSLLRRETFITVPSFRPQEEEEEAVVGTPDRLDVVEGEGLMIVLLTGVVLV